MATVHVIPIDDWIEHQTEGDHLTCDCLCCPTVEQHVCTDVEGNEHISYLIIHQKVEPEEPEPQPRWYYPIVRWFIRLLVRIVGDP